MTNRTTPVGTVDEELVGTRLTKIDDRLRERLGGIEIEQFGGDNFAVWLCSQFADPDDEDEDDCGWGPTALRGYEAVIAAIHAHYTPRLEQLLNRVERLTERAEDAAHAAYRQGYRDGYVDASIGDDGWPEDDGKEILRGVQSTAIADGWQNYADTFRAALTGEHNG